MRAWVHRDQGGHDPAVLTCLTRGDVLSTLLVPPVTCRVGQIQ